MIRANEPVSGKQTGYSLIELLVVLAIVGIISAIAYPAYQGYLTDTYRAQAITDLRVCALALERYFSDDFTYEGATIGTPPADECNSASPTQGAVQFDLSFSSGPTQNNFTIQAIPTGESSCGGKCIRLSADGTQVEI